MFAGNACYEVLAPAVTRWLWFFRAWVKRRNVVADGDFHSYFFVTAFFPFFFFRYGKRGFFKRIAFREWNVKVERSCLIFFDFCVGMVIKVMRIDYVETRSDFEINFKWQADAPRLTQLVDIRLAWSNTETSLCIGLEDKF